MIDKTGVILWVNDAMCNHFGYSEDELLQENIRICMPQPYAGQHDHFLKRYGIP